jgi:hypothetical protein
VAKSFSSALLLIASPNSFLAYTVGDHVMYECECEKRKMQAARPFALLTHQLASLVDISCTSLLGATTVPSILQSVFLCQR